MKGRTRWTPRSVHPIRNGTYECIVQISRAVPPMIWMLEWDGKGFLVPVPMIVHRWRGLTKKAYISELEKQRNEH